MYVLTKEEMSSLDRLTIDRIGIPELVLMENAGKGCADYISTIYPKDKSIAIFCGQGNNGGDGFVVARWLLLKGYKTTVFFVGNLNKMTTSTSRNYEILLKMSQQVHQVSTTEDWEYVWNSLFVTETSRYSLIIDALFGIGLRGSLKDPYSTIVTQLNSLPAEKISIDISTGIEANSGCVEGVAFQADITMTMAVPKYGHYTGSGKRFSGKIVPIDIGIPVEMLLRDKHAAMLVDDSIVSYPKRERTFHKGQYGRIAIIAGSVGYSGAAILSARAALHSGGGLITLFHPLGMDQIFESLLVEVMTKAFPVSETDIAKLEPAYDSEELPELPVFDEWLKSLKKYDALLLGPGLGVNPLSIALVNFITKKWQKPLVIDADAINILAQYPDWIPRINRADVILTPHVGEFLRIINLASAAFKQDPMKFLKQFAVQHKLVTLLKDTTRFICVHNRLLIDPSGNDGLATGGSGDVLAGITVSFLAQKLLPLDAAVAASYLLGKTAESCALYKQTPAITPSDIIDRIFCNEL